MFFLTYYLFIFLMSYFAFKYLISSQLDVDYPVDIATSHGLIDEDWTKSILQYEN